MKRIWLDLGLDLQDDATGSTARAPHNRKARGLLYGTTAIFVALMATSVSAQAGNGPQIAPHSSNGTGSGQTASPEIVVTALKRSQNLQSVPASITAVSGTVLATKQLANPEDITALVPNLQFAQGAGEGVPIFALRGISLSDTAPNQSGPIATYYDEVFKGSYPLLPVGMYDLERVEVLRGPQGTLYGKNTTGGAINFVSHRPGFDTDGYLSGGYGSYNRISLEGAAQTALTERLAVRVAFTFLRQDGWMHNLYPGKPDLNGARQYSVRGSLLYNATDRLSFLLRVETSYQDPHNYGFYAVPTDAGGLVGIGGGIAAPPYFRTGLSRRQIESEFTPRFRHRTASAALTTNWTINDALALTSISSFDYGYENAPDDDDGSPTMTLEGLRLKASVRQYAEDLRLTSKGESRLSFITGAYFNRETQRDGQTYRFLADQGGVCDLAAFTSCVAKTDFDQIKQSEALYADLTYKMTDVFVIHGGLRYTHDAGHVSHYDGGYYNLDERTPVFIGVDNGYAKYDTNNVSGKIGVDYHLDADRMIYFSASRGFRGSAFNFNAFDGPEEIAPSKPETLTSLEGGFKTQWFDRKLTLNGAVYYYFYRNQQSQNNVNGFTELYGIPKSRVAGAEFEASLRPTPDLTLAAGLGLTYTRIQRAVINGVDLAGHMLPLASKVTSSGSITWTVWRGERRAVDLSADVAYRSKVYFDLNNTERLAQHPYALVNAQVTLRTLGNGPSITLWAKNLTNKFYYTNNFDISGYGYDLANLGDPREVGVSLRFPFK